MAQYFGIKERPKAPPHPESSIILANSDSEESYVHTHTLPKKKITTTILSDKCSLEKRIHTNRRTIHPDC